MGFHYLICLICVFVNYWLFIVWHAWTFIIWCVILQCLMWTVSIHYFFSFAVWISLVFTIWYDYLLSECVCRFCCPLQAGLSITLPSKTSKLSPWLLLFMLVSACVFHLVRWKHLQILKWACLIVRSQAMTGPRACQSSYNDSWLTGATVN